MAGRPDPLSAEHARRLSRRALTLALIAAAALAHLPVTVIGATDAPAEPIEIADVFMADRLVLADGRTARPVGVLVPGTLGGGGAGRALGRRARLRVQELLTAGKPHLRVLGQDRQGRIVGEVMLPDGSSLSELLLGEGLAWVDGSSEDPGQARRLELEATARAAGRGLWAMPELGVQRAESVSAEPARFVVVEGMVVEVSSGEPWTYLNFGEDWRRDFTVRMAPAVARSLKRAGTDPALLSSRRVRVRGWTMDINGPMIEIVAKGQLEVLE